MNSNEIKIIGVGMSGIEVLERMKPDTLIDTDLVVCDIDSNNLSKSSLENKIHIVTGKTRTLSPKTLFDKDSHMNVELDLAMDATINAFDQFDSILTESFQMVIVIANLGDSTGTGVTPIIAQIAKKRGLFVAAIVNNPFELLGIESKRMANYGLKKLNEDCDLVLAIDHNKLQKLYGKTSLIYFFKKSEQIMIRLVKMILPLDSTNWEQLDLRLFFKKHQEDKNLYIGIGEAFGKWRAIQAIEEALKNTLYYREDIEGTTNVFLDIYFGNTIISIEEKSEIKKRVIQYAGKNAAVQFSINKDILLEESISIIVVAF